MSSRDDALVQVWPLFGLWLRCGDVELRLPTDSEVAHLAEQVARHGVHDPETMPFLTPWTDRQPPDLQRGTLQWHWRQRAEWTPEDWTLELAVFVDGEPVGAQGMTGRDFAVRRVVETGSWLLRPFQGAGVGKAMRTAVLALAFDGLGALEARSGAFTDNLASSGVSKAVGYLDNGYDVVVRRGERAVERRYVLDAQRWRDLPRVDVRIDGLAPCLPLFGVPGAGDTGADGE